ncbi:MAG: hypothetical protein ACTHZ1_01660 [Sphingobacterium sp.]
MQSYFAVCLYFCALAFLPISAGASAPEIHDFTVKENLSQNGKLAVIALDPTQQTDNRIQGTYSFAVNGFQQDLTFTDGVAVTSHPVQSSTFAFFKHEAEKNEVGRFFFLRITDTGVKTYRINSILLIILPLVVLYIAYKLKRFLITLLVVALVYYYMNQTKGLDLSQIIEGISSSVKGLF